MPAVVSREHLNHSYHLRALLSAYARSEDLIRIGAYGKGADPVLDRAIAVLPELQAFLRQTPQRCPAESRISQHSPRQHGGPTDSSKLPTTWVTRPRQLTAGRDSNRLK